MDIASILGFCRCLVGKEVKYVLLLKIGCPCPIVDNIVDGSYPRVLELRGHQSGLYFGGK